MINEDELMNAGPVTIGIVGCGRVAQHYLNIFESGVVNNFKIVAAVDIIEERAKSFGVRFQCQVYTCPETMINEVQPNLVLVLTPSSLHYLHTRIALELNCHVLVEKPISMIPSEADELDELARSKSLLYGVAFQNRLNPAIVALRQAVKEQRFGKIVTATIRLRWCRFQEYYEDGWHGTWAHDGGVINQQAIHHLDALNWLFPIESVSATIANRLNDLEAEDTIVGMVKFENGAIGTIEATTAARPQDYEASLSVVGEKGMVLIGGIALNEVHTWEFIDVKEGDDIAPKVYSQEVDTGYGISHGPLLNTFILAIIGQSNGVPVTAADAIKTTRVVHALYKSDEIKAWVKLNDNPISERLGVKV